MKISIRTRQGYSRAEVTVESGNTKIVEDVSNFISVHKSAVPDTFIEDLVSVAHECSQFNEVSNVDFCLKICESFLNDHDREELIQKLNNAEK